VTKAKTDDQKVKRSRPVHRAVEPEVRWLAEELNLQHITPNGVADASGVSRPTIVSWFDGASPGFPNLKAVLGTLGYEFAIVPLESDGEVEYRIHRLFTELKIPDDDRLKLRSMASMSGRSVAEVAAELLTLLLANGAIIAKKGTRNGKKRPRRR
jgi:hypothetical protein